MEGKPQQQRIRVRQRQFIQLEGKKCFTITNKVIFNDKKKHAFKLQVVVKFAFPKVTFDEIGEDSLVSKTNCTQ